MILQIGADLLQPEWPGAVVCVGTFDGVHLGHRHVIENAVALGSEQERPSVVVTFDRHPLAVIAPERKPPALAPLEENLAQIASTGASACVVMLFDRQLAEQTPDWFFENVMLRACRARHVVVGHDFRFGKDRAGDAAWLAARIPATIVPPFQKDGRRVSSSEIRAHVSAGEVEAAALLLGRPFALRGVVVAGRKLGRQLGFPTINVARATGDLLPADGVYAGRCRVNGHEGLAAINAGLRPTLNGPARTVEAHLLDYEGPPLYGATVRVEFLRRLREERRFPGLDALAEQIRQDLAQVRKLLGGV
jgi:riboflavin kinase/FMN adenylyltransferase